MTRTNLSPHFTLEEMIASQMATRLGLSNMPSGPVVDNLRALCVNVLEPLRELVGRPIAINSAFRSPEVNRRIGGAATSQHLTGNAVDFEVPGLDNLETAHLLASSSIAFDQLILEFYVTGDPSSGWVHASYVSLPRKPRGQVLTISRVGASTAAVGGLPPRSP